MPACQICLQSAQSNQEGIAAAQRFPCRSTAGCCVSRADRWCFSSSPKVGPGQALHPWGLGCCGCRTDPSQGPREPVVLSGTHLFFLISLKKSMEGSDSSRPSSQSRGICVCFPFPGSTRCLGKVAGPQGRSCWTPPTATLRHFLLGATP